jgi:hypothetical protein
MVSVIFGCALHVLAQPSASRTGYAVAIRFWRGGCACPRRAGSLAYFLLAFVLSCVVAISGLRTVLCAFLERQVHVVRRDERH